MYAVLGQPLLKLTIEPTIVPEELQGLSRFVAFANAKKAVYCQYHKRTEPGAVPEWPDDEESRR